MSKVAMLTTAGDLIPIAQEHDITDYDELRSYMSMLPKPYDWFEPVHIQIGKHKYIMVVDEEGKIKGAAVNIKATKLYSQYDVICGDVLIFSDHSDPDMYALEKDEWDALEAAVQSVHIVHYSGTKS